MTPLADMDAATLRRIEGVLFDVDDTLTTHGALTPSAYLALSRLREHGLGAIAVTGRPLGWSDGMAASWPVDMAIGENGAGWAYRDGAGLRFGVFDPTISEVKRNALRTAVREAMPHVNEADDQPARRCDIAWDVNERASLPEDDIDALLALIEAAGARSFVSSVHAHAAFGAWDKAAGARRAVVDAGLSVDLDRWVFIGDSANDAAAFASFPTTVGVANVEAHLHRLAVPPRWVTQKQRGEGFEELVNALIGARR
ncbi:MAG: HAD family hydrolase [Sandaracinaceae bacterium]